jgi:hypothetical protein
LLGDGMLSQTKFAAGLFAQADRDQNQELDEEEFSTALLEQTPWQAPQPQG